MSSKKTAADPLLIVTPIFEGIDVSNFVLRTPLEVSYVLRQLAKKHEPLSIYYDHGKGFFITTLLQVNLESQRFWLATTEDQKIDTAFLQASHALVVAAPDGIKNQFSLKGEDIELGTFDGKPAFNIAVPNRLIKLQRRDFFRIETPINKPLLCKIPLANHEILSLVVHDISVTGVGLWLDETHNFTPLENFPHCRIDLGIYGLIEVTLEIRSTRQIIRRDGSVRTLMGTYFIGLNRSTDTLLQRYISKLEQERHQKLLLS